LGAVVAELLLTTTPAPAAGVRFDDAQKPWKFSILHQFQGPPDGSGPVGGLVLGPHGRIYGMTSSGGTLNDGTLFRLTRRANSFDEQILHDFGRGQDAAGPGGDDSVVLESDGTVIGITANGGDSGAGAVFVLKPSARGYRESVIHSFSATGDGANPFCPPVVTAAGAIYGATSNGEESGAGGTAFGLTPTPSGYAESFDFHFISISGGSDGFDPGGGLTAGPTGTLFGTTEFGEDKAYFGTVYELMPAPLGIVRQTIYRFNGTDGSNPIGQLLIDSAGDLYGVTSSSVRDDGVVYTLRPSPSGYSETVLHTFTGADGNNPSSGLVADAHGTLYGTTNFGGNGPGCGRGGCGVVFALTPTRSGYKERVLYNFQGADDGAYPQGPLIFDGSSLIGAAGTSIERQGDGNVFRLTPP